MKSCKSLSKDSNPTLMFDAIVKADELTIRRGSLTTEWKESNWRVQKATNELKNRVWTDGGKAEDHSSLLYGFRLSSLRAGGTKRKNKPRDIGFSLSGQCFPRSSKKELALSRAVFSIKKWKLLLLFIYLLLQR